jgi:hypothetical protein
MINPNQFTQNLTNNICHSCERIFYAYPSYHGKPSDSPPLMFGWRNWFARSDAWVESFASSTTPEPPPPPNLTKPPHYSASLRYILHQQHSLHQVTPNKFTYRDNFHIIRAALLLTTSSQTNHYAKPKIQCLNRHKRSSRGGLPGRRAQLQRINRNECRGISAHPLHYRLVQTSHHAHSLPQIRTSVCPAQ